MGCDIHANIEHQPYQDGMWRDSFAKVGLSRDYWLFAAMANVRNGARDIEPVAEPRGLPEKIAFGTKEHFEHWSHDAHSTSWLNTDEFKEAIERSRKATTEAPQAEALAALAAMKVLRERSNNVRIVFWFDN